MVHLIQALKIESKMLYGFGDYAQLLPPHTGNQ